MSNQSKTSADENCRTVGYAPHFRISKYPKVGFPAVQTQLGTPLYFVVHHCVDSQWARSGAQGSSTASAPHPELPMAPSTTALHSTNTSSGGLTQGFTLPNTGIPWKHRSSLLQNRDIKGVGYSGLIWWLDKSDMNKANGPLACTGCSDLIQIQAKYLGWIVHPQKI